MIHQTQELWLQDYLITTDRSKLNVNEIYEWLSFESYWSKGISRETVATAFENSFVAGVLHQGRQIGYARLITDYATFAYLADVYIMEAHRGKGLSKAMLSLLLGLDWVKSLRRVLLATLDAHGLYRQFGFEGPRRPERLMERNKPEPYGPGSSF